MKKHNSFDIELAMNTSDFEGIYTLQKKNLAHRLSSEEILSQGFVTVDHELSMIERMNNPYPHIIAKCFEELIGYALVMTRELQAEIPILIPMFRQINAMDYNGHNLAESKYVVMGQICIDKAYRGKGVFKALYQRMSQEMAPNFRYIITEISPANKRSLRAHENTGFKMIGAYADEEGNEWVLVLLEIDGTSH